MDKARVHAAVSMLRAHGKKISVRGVHAVIGGSFRDVTRHLRQLRAEGVLGDVSGGESAPPDAWRPLAPEEARQVARRLLTGEVLVYTDPAGEIAYVIDKAAVPAPAWRRLSPIRVRLLAYLIDWGDTTVSQHIRVPGLYRVVRCPSPLALV